MQPKSTTPTIVVLTLTLLFNADIAQCSKCTANETQTFALVLMKIDSDLHFPCDNVIGYDALIRTNTCDYYVKTWGKDAKGIMREFITRQLTFNSNSVEWPYDLPEDTANRDTKISPELTARMTLAEWPKKLSIDLWDSDDDSDDCICTFHDWHINKIIRSENKARADADNLQHKIHTVGTWHKLSLGLKEFCV